MPLKAIVDGVTIIGPDLTKEEWTTLKSRHKKGLTITMGCCGAPGHLRISKKGIQHFYHAVDTGCNYQEESREHLEIKYQIYRTCKSEGCETYVEFQAPGRTWISDVYAIRDGRKIVFEIQISTISPNVLEERDKKYQNEGIESYWLLDNFLERSKDFASWYHSHLNEEDERQGEPIPYIDNSLFETGPENHIFIAKGIRSVGLNAKDQTLFTTNNPKIPLAVWVREVLKGNYQHYLKETAAAYHEKRRLKNLAAPLLIQFREFYQKIIRDDTFRKKVDSRYRKFNADKTLRKDKALQFDELYSEIDWLGKEYRACIAESYGLFVWRKMPEKDVTRPFFRLESELKVRKLKECVERFERWEVSFQRAFSDLKREIMADTRLYEE